MHTFLCYCPDMGVGSVVRIQANDAETAAEYYAEEDYNQSPWDGDFIVVHVIDDVRCIPAQTKTFEVSLVEGGYLAYPT